MAFYKAANFKNRKPDCSELIETTMTGGFHSKKGFSPRLVKLMRIESIFCLVEKKERNLKIKSFLNCNLINK